MRIGLPGCVVTFPLCFNALVGIARFLNVGAFLEIRFSF